MRVGRMTFDVILFSIVALKTLDISQTFTSDKLEVRWDI